MLGYWFFNVNNADLQLKAVLKWLGYPLVYIAFITIRGGFSGYYPYPFLNVSDIGYEKALLNTAIIFALLLVLFMALSFLGKTVIRTRRI